jgi:hypothetical protein
MHRANENGRSLQDELRHILELAAEETTQDHWNLADEIRKRLEGKPQSDSGNLQADDRDR